MIDCPNDWPALSGRHLDCARLYAHREDLTASLALRRAPVIAEVGVARGDFSEFLVRQFAPKKFVAFDTFTMHEWSDCWGTPTVEYFGGLTQVDCYRARMRGFSKCVSLEIGPSRETLARQRPGTFDLIYIDAQHDYESVLLDATLSARALRPDGFLVFNDYVLFDPFIEAYYGVVPVVNDMVANQEWKVAGLALDPQMFCDIAIYRGGSATTHRISR